MLLIISVYYLMKGNIMDITKEIKAYNMKSNNGNIVPNQIIIEDKKRHEYIFHLRLVFFILLLFTNPVNSIP